MIKTQMQKIDELRRIALPKEMMEELGWETHESVYITCAYGEITQRREKPKPMAPVAFHDFMP